MEITLFCLFCGLPDTDRRLSLQCTGLCCSSSGEGEYEGLSAVLFCSGDGEYEGLGAVCCSSSGEGEYEGRLGAVGLLRGAKGLLGGVGGSEVVMGLLGGVQVGRVGAAPRPEGPLTEAKGPHLGLSQSAML